MTTLLCAETRSAKPFSSTTTRRNGGRNRQCVFRHDWCDHLRAALLTRYGQRLLAPCDNGLRTSDGQFPIRRVQSQSVGRGHIKQRGGDFCYISESPAAGRAVPLEGLQTGNDSVTDLT